MLSERPRGTRGSHWVRSLLAAINPYKGDEEAVFTGPEDGRATSADCRRPQSCFGGRLSPPPAAVASC
ncbi:jg9323 [Pararge aegeria aegeria]|uniref:Jg9323 protein n=1 Tax=Pararge aegeria aegeria TaxID=348720 RepID=A0A8S4S185_9NEOP|nr:jg9323 [Pararge aegeria aegeria]